MITRFEASGRRWPALAAVVALIVGALALSGATRAADKNKPGAAGGLPGAAGAAGAASAAPAPGEGSTASPDGPAQPRAVDYRLAGPISPEDEKANARTAEKLKKPIDKINFNGQGLSDVVDFLRDAAGVDILVEWPALEQIGVSKDAPVTLVLREPTPVDAVLPLMFRSMGMALGYEIDKGVVVIGSKSNGPATMVMRVYDVSDLVANLEGGKTTAVQPPATGASDASGGGGGPVGGPPNNPAAGGPGAAGSPFPANFIGGGGAMEQLVTLILSTVQPNLWIQNGGQASIGVFKSKLVIKAPEAVHKELASLLEMLREKPAGATRTTTALPNATREARP